jgi:hypothetical protein
MFGCSDAQEDESISLCVGLFVNPDVSLNPQQKSRCDIKFVKWFVRKSRTLSMSNNDDELNEFIDEVTDGTYNLPCVEVIFKLVKQMQP